MMRSFDGSLQKPSPYNGVVKWSKTLGSYPSIREFKSHPRHLDIRLISYQAISNGFTVLDGERTGDRRPRSSLIVSALIRFCVWGFCLRGKAWVTGGSPLGR